MSNQKNMLDSFTNPRCYDIPNIFYLLSKGRILGFELTDVKLLCVNTEWFEHLSNSRKDIYTHSSASAKVPGSSSSLCMIQKRLECSMVAINSSGESLNQPRRVVLNTLLLWSSIPSHSWAFLGNKRCCVGQAEMQMKYKSELWKGKKSLMELWDD